jgi:nucleoside-diphosphate-sugar epimerase
MKKILIIGGTGFIGYHLAKRCIKEKFQVTSISSKKPSKTRLIKKIRYRYCNIKNFNELKNSTNIDFDYVVNLGGYVNHKNKKKTYDSHFLGVKNLYKVFKDKSIKAFIQIGSSSEYGNSRSPLKEKSLCNPLMIYGRSKLMATNFLLNQYKLNSFPVTILRFFQIYGPSQKPNRLIPIVINSSLKNKKFKCSDGQQLRDFLYVDDAIEAILKSLKNKKAKGKIINIGYGKPIKVKKIILMIIDIIKKGRPLFGKLTLRVDEPKLLFPSLNFAKKTLNWRSKIDIKKGLLRTINYYRSNA